MAAFPTQYKGADFQLIPYEPNHLPLLLKAMHDSAILMKRWVPWAKDHMTEAEGQMFIDKAAAGFRNGDSFKFGVFDHSKSKLLGSIGFHKRGYATPWNLAAEMGLWISMPENGRGLGTKVVQETCKWAFWEWPFTRLVWRCDEENIASHRIAEKADFNLEATFQHAERSHRGPWRTTRVYTQHKLKVDFSINPYQVEQLHLTSPKSELQRTALIQSTYFAEIFPVKKTAASYSPEIHSANYHYKRLQQLGQKKIILVCRAGQSQAAILGTVCCRVEETGYGVMEQVCVPSFYQRRGVGKALFAAAKNYFRDRKCRQFSTRIAQHNPNVIKFYIHMGGHIKDSDEEFKSLEWKF
tara:strand:- start:638 stop:1699 length:1062 start_codon:yes stop_codon:yes gene_type:complete